MTSREKRDLHCSGILAHTLHHRDINEILQQNKEVRFCQNNSL